MTSESYSLPADLSTLTESDLREHLRSVESLIDRDGFGRGEVRTLQESRRRLFAALRSTNSAARQSHRVLSVPAYPGTLVSFQESADHGFILTYRTDTPGPEGYTGPQLHAVEYGMDLEAMGTRAYVLLLRYIADANRKLAIAYGRAEETRRAAEPKPATAAKPSLNNLLADLGL